MQLLCVGDDIVSVKSGLFVIDDPVAQASLFLRT